MFDFSLTSSSSTPNFIISQGKSVDYLFPLHQLLNNWEIRNQSTANLLCRLIPVQCPFERQIYLFGRKIGYIPPLCKLNPLYDEVVALRFRALCYLVDECGQEVH